MKKAQSSIEVTLLIGFMFLTFNIFLLVIAERMVDVQNQKDRQLIDDMGSVIEGEIELAAGVENGYSRTFEIPQTLKGINYSVILINSTYMKTNYSELVLKYIDFTKTYETVKKLPKNVYGNIYKGENKIVKNNGVVYLNTEYPSEEEGPGEELCYIDADDDGYRPDLTSTVVNDDMDCTDSGEAESTDPNGDCDDSNPLIHPGATEVCYDGLDNDCDDKIDCDDTVNCPLGIVCNEEGTNTCQNVGSGPECLLEEPENWLSGWDKRIKFTIDSSKIDSDLTWFPVMVSLGPSSDSIDVGSSCTDRTGQLYGGSTQINLANPVTQTGKITSVQIWAKISIADIKVAIFTKNGDNYTARSASSYLGAVSSGAARTFTVDLDAVEGDYLGVYFLSNSEALEASNSGGTGIAVLSGDQTACVNQEAYNTFVGWATSVYATGIAYHGKEVFTEFDADSDYLKVAFTKDDGTTQLYTEKELFDDSEQKAVYHISRDDWTISSSSDTVFYMYYDNDHADNTNYIGAIDTTAGGNVWDSNFAAVYHMADATTSTVKDSTSNDNDGTKKGANEPVEAVGKVGQGQDLDGINDYLTVADSNSLDMGSTFTASLWVNYEDGSAPDNYERMLTKKLVYNAASGWEFSLENTYDSGLTVRGSSGAGYCPNGAQDVVPSWAAGGWYYITVVYDGTTATVYRDGVERDTVTIAAASDTSNPLQIGRYGASATDFWVGKLDEIRLSDTIETGAWIKATYNSLWDTLLTYGNEETKY